MELSRDDIRRLEKAGHHRDQFSVIDKHVIRLLNVNGHCYFYNLTERKCKVYKNRPIGCRLYPIVYSAEKGTIVDTLCPMRHTVTEREIKTKGNALHKLLRKLDEERRSATPSY